MLLVGSVVKGERNEMHRNRYRAKDFSNEITARSARGKTSSIVIAGLMCAMRVYGGPYGPCKLKTHTGQIGVQRIDRLRSINSAPDPRVIYCAGSSFSSRRPVDVLVIKLRDRSIAGREASIDTCYGSFVALR